MANPELAVDTSIVIDYFRKRNKRKSVLFQIVDDYTLYLPARLSRSTPSTFSGSAS
jgi:hypothetical protein